MSVLFEVKNLSVRFGDNRIIDKLSFKVKEEDNFIILGPNGAGKSVLLKTLLGFIPYQGEIVWHKKPKLGYLPQGLTQMRVKDFPLTVQDFFALKYKSVSIDEVVHFLELVGLDKSILQQRAGHLSGGQFQRMLIAWILISHPNVVFFDEPTTGIDIGGGETIHSLLHTIQLKEKITIILVTHDLSVVYKYSSNVLCLSKKKHICSGPPKEILTPKMLENVFGEEIKFHHHH